MLPRLSPPEVFTKATETLQRAERETQLFWRATPEDPRAASVALAASVRTGRAYRPLRPGPAVDLSAIRGALAAIESRLTGEGPIAELVVARARELSLEASLAEALYSTELPALAAARFPAPSGELAFAVDELVARALAHAPPPAVAEHRSDDAADARSLVSRLRRGASEMALPLRIEIRSRQLAVAATGEGLVAVRPFVMLTREASERVAVHELFAHALPRFRAATLGVGLLRAGTARSGDHEEGRAILIEERRGFLGAERLHDLALRHRAALSVRASATPEETVKLVLELGATLDRALDLALRVHRGGGLAREIVYLPSYVEVCAAFAAEPTLETWFERGRMSLAGARCFAEHGLPGLVSQQTPRAC
jgi:hypothetical protein